MNIDSIQIYRDGARKVKAIKLNVAMKVKANKNSFYRCISSKKKTMENVNLLLMW